MANRVHERPTEFDGVPGRVDGGGCGKDTPGAPNELAAHVVHLELMEQVCVANSWPPSPLKGGGEASAGFGIGLLLPLDRGDETIAQAGDIQPGEVGGAGEAGGDVHR